MKKAIVTNIHQHEVRVLGPEDFEGYERNRPGPRWELVEFINLKRKKGEPHRVWVPDYTLRTPKINDFSKVKIVLE